MLISSLYARFFHMHYSMPVGLCLSLILTFNVKSAEITNEQLSEKMSLVMNYFKTSEYNVNYFWVSDIESPFHSFAIDLLKDNVNNVTAYPNNTVRFGATKVLDYYFVGLKDKSLCWSKILDFSNCKLTHPKQSIEGRADWVYWQAKDYKAFFKLAYLHNNSELLRQLSKYKQFSYETAYDHEIQGLTDHLLSLLDSNLQYSRRFMNESHASYSGFNQGKIVQALIEADEYTNIGAELTFICENYVHSSEGVYNHWATSVIGYLNCLNYQQKNDFEFKYIVAIKMQELYQRLPMSNGKIPYIIDKNHSNYPSFKATYQTWDLLYLVQIDKLLELNTGLNNYFDIAYQEALNVNYGLYFANNLESALIMEHNNVDQKFDQAIRILNNLHSVNDIDNIKHALSLVRVIVLLRVWNDSRLFL